MKAEKISVLHGNTSRSLLLSAVIPRLLGKKVIWHVRGELNGLSGGLKMVCEKLSTSIWLVASILSNQISANARHKAFVIYNGVSPDSVPDVRKYKIENPKNKFIICTFAAVTPFKGYHHLIDAIRIVNAEMNPQSIEFLAIGDLFDQEYIDFLNKKIEQSKIINFKFLGWQDDPFYFYAMADLVVLPTVVNEKLTINGKQITVKTGEGLPRTILEAMYLEKLMVSTVVAGSPEQIINGKTGFLVKPGDANELAQNILKAFRLSDVEKTQIQRAAGDRARQVFDACKLSITAADKIKSMV